MMLLDNAMYVHAKESCYLCGNPNCIVDTEVPIEGEGVLAICVRCIRDLAQTAHMNVDAEADLVLLIGEHNSVLAQLAEEKARTKDLRRALRAAKTPVAVPTPVM